MRFGRRAPQLIRSPIDSGEKHTAQTDIVVVVQLVDGLNLATNVQLLDSLVQVDDSRVLGVTTEDKFTLLLPKKNQGGKNTSAIRPTKKHERPRGSHCVRKSRLQTPLNANADAPVNRQSPNGVRERAVTVSPLSHAN